MKKNNSYDKKQKKLQNDSYQTLVVQKHFTIFEEKAIVWNTESRMMNTVSVWNAGQISTVERIRNSVVSNVRMHTTTEDTRRYVCTKQR